MKLLALDTATEGCSAALWIDGAMIHREVEVGRGHSGLILSMIDQLLAEGAVALGSLDALAFGRGPGSFTGVRLAASVAQGLAFGAGLPVVPVSDLRAVAQRAWSEGGDAATPHALVCNDARMHEVYWGCFELGADRLMHPVGEEHVGPPATVEVPGSWAGLRVTGAGRGFRAYPVLRDRLGAALTHIAADILPGAPEIACLAVAEARVGNVLLPEQAVPVYLRDDVARPKQA